MTCVCFVLQIQKLLRCASIETHVEISLGTVDITQLVLLLALQGMHTCILVCPVRVHYCQDLLVRTYIHGCHVISSLGLKM